MQDDDQVTDKDTGMVHGVPGGAASDQSKGVPDSGRHESETVAHPAGGKDKAKDV